MYGDQVYVEVIRASKEDSQVDFELTNEMDKKENENKK